MQVIPVIDILDGSVVRGVAGQRDSYRPIVSRLRCVPEPRSVAEAFREQFQLTTLYIADLDGILRQAPHWDVYRELSSDRFALWIDAGVSDPAHAEAVLAAGAERVVCGLESLPAPATLREIVQHCGADRIVFSLDLQQGIPLAAAAWQPREPLAIAELALELGIRQLIVLDLAQVGVGKGLSTVPLCQAIRTACPGATVITGGGVRGPGDLQELRGAGIDGVLVASALHDGRLSPADVR